MLAICASLTLGLGLQAEAPTIPQTFVATITTNSSGTSSVVQRGVSTMKQYYDYANKRLRKDAEDGSTKIYRYDDPKDPPFPPNPGDPDFKTPKGYQFQLNNPNMTCCWLWLMDADTKVADRMYELTIPKKSVDVGSDADGEHWANVAHFPFLQTDDYWLKNASILTKHNSFSSLPKALGPQAGTIISNSTYADVTVGPIDISTFWVPDARPTFGKCKEFGHDPQCSMEDAAGLLAGRPSWL
jgi:hypothetical protein